MCCGIDCLAGIITWKYNLNLFDKEKLINIHLGKWDLTTVLPVLYNGSSEGIISLSVAISAYIFNMAFMSIAGVYIASEKLTFVQFNF